MEKNLSIMTVLAILVRPGRPIESSEVPLTCLGILITMRGFKIDAQ
jgi:hypothetical protein